MPRLAAAHASMLAPRANEGGGLFWGDLLQHAEAALFPAGPDIEVSAVCDQEVEQIEIGSSNVHGRALEVEHRLVDARGKLTVRLE